MSIAAVQELIAKQALDQEVLSHFVDFDRGEVTLRFESEYWDYKRALPNFDDPREVAELAADVLAFHNSRGGYLIYGITDDFSVLGIREQDGTQVDSNILNSKLKRYKGETFICRYSSIPAVVGGTRKVLGLILIPRRKAIAIPVEAKSAIFNKGELFLRSNDTRKRAQSDAEFLPKEGSGHKKMASMPDWESIPLLEARGILPFSSPAGKRKTDNLRELKKSDRKILAF